MELNKNLPSRKPATAKETNQVGDSQLQAHHN
jgi:hypothetical protein